MAKWQAFPHDNSAFGYAGKALQAAWDELHRGDCVPWPVAGELQETLQQHPGAAPKGFKGDVKQLALDLQQAWRQFHAGAFGAAIDAASAIGALGHAVANKATGIHATYLETDSGRQQALFLDAAMRAEQAVELLPGDPNSHYLHAFNLGRYSQSISVVEALRQGIGGKILACLARTLELEPGHAEAHTALGLYHAEIVNKVGRMIGSLTYGASADKAVAHFEQALELTPDAPIAHIEYGNGLYLLFGDKRLDEVTDLYIKASEMTARDAMEALDIEAARSELE
jgi:tetratricopeptide (TPR) repeat protein